jgi:acyl-[acyl-carrier-protein]-phospholipid O-acyltransferase/long-chain-fatty-acid--[acyl-carrier-protein] ligase
MYMDESTGKNGSDRDAGAATDKRRSFVPLFATNLFGTVNDNFLKTLASFTVIGWIADPRLKPLFMGATAGALVLPYILCSPLADRLALRFEKRKIVRLAKWAELPIMAVAIAGFLAHSTWAVVGAVLLMGLQSSLYSPAKYALVRDIGGEERISTGMGGMEGIAFLGMLSGTIAASVAVDRAPPWVQYGCLAGFALGGLVASYWLRAKEVRGTERRPVDPLRFFAESARMVSAQRGLQAVVLTLSVFWWGAAMLQMGLLIYGREVLGLDATRTGLMLCAAAVGIVAGQVLAGLADKRWGLLRTVPLAGWVAAALLLALFAVPMGPGAFAAVLGALAFDLGFFKLPLDAEIQKVVKGPRLNTVLAYFNQVSFLFMFAASLCYAGLSWAFGPRAFLAAMAVAFAVVPALFALSYRPVLLQAGRWALGRRYAVRLEGAECLEGEGPLLVLPNHPAMVDPMLVATELWRLPLRPLVDERFFRAGLLTRLALGTLDAVSVPDLVARRSRRGAETARALANLVPDTLAAGGSVIFYPSGHIQTEDGREEIGNRRLAYEACRSLPGGVRVVGVRTTGLWGSIWSRAGRNASPPFVPTLLRSMALWLFAVPFLRRRKVTMHLEDLTERAKAWSEGTRQEFNRRLEAWYEGRDGAAPEAALPIGWDA